jgi:arylsulfatase A-like enzyme
VSLALLVGTAWCAAGCAPAGPADDQRPHVILIVLDTLRADHTGLHGYDRDTTPFLDSLATRGIVFERAYATASWTRASVASLFTSRLPPGHGCENRAGRLAPELDTMAELLASRGYRTAGVVSNGNVDASFGFGQGFDRYVRPKGDEEDYVDAATLNATIEQVLDGLDPGPAFLYLHYKDPHAPYRHHPETDFDPDYRGDLAEASKQRLRDYAEQRTALGAIHDERVRALYDGEIAWLDRRLAELFELLERRGLLERAWVVVTSDHGEGLWSHQVRGHGYDVFEEQVRVPLLLMPPGGAPSARRVEPPFSQLDLLPTLLDLLEFPHPEGLEGLSWAGFLESRGPSPSRPVLVDQRLSQRQTPDDPGASFAALIDGHRKLIWDRNRELVWLFDLVADPGERDGRRFDLGGGGSLDAEASELHARLVEALEQAAQRRPATNTRVELESLPEDLRGHLQALGYLGDGES